jgi:hypothetical protein
VARVSRIPSGHPEGYLEAFATLYAEIAQAIRAARKGGPTADLAAQFPTLVDGIADVAFIEAVWRRRHAAGAGSSCRLEHRPAVAAPQRTTCTTPAKTTTCI